MGLRDFQVTEYRAYCDRGTDPDCQVSHGPYRSLNSALHTLRHGWGWRKICNKWVCYQCQTDAERLEQEAH